MTAPVVIPVEARGVPEALNAFKSLRQAMVDMEAASLAAAESGSKKRLAILHGEMAERAKILKDTARRNVDEGMSRTFGRSGPSARSSADATRPGSNVMDSFMKGEGFGGMMKAAGVAGLAVGLLTSAVGLATSALKQFGSFVINDVIKPAWALETYATQLANNSAGTLTGKQVESGLRASAVANNLDPMVLGKAFEKFQGLTGDPRMGLDIMGTTAMLAKGRGFDPVVLAEMQAANYQKGVTKKQMDEFILRQVAQGDAGQIPLGELARINGGATAPVASFAGDYATRLSTGNAMLQTSRKGFRSTEETATAYQAFIRESMTAARSIPKAIMTTGSGTQLLTDPARLIGDLFRRTSGNVPALHALGYTEGARFVGAYREPYKDAFDKAKGQGKTDVQAREEGAKAVEDFIRTIALSRTTLEEESAKRDAVEATTGEKWDAAVNQVKAKLLEIMPSVDGLVADFTKNAPAIAKAALDIANAMVDIVGVFRDIARGMKLVSDRFFHSGETADAAHGGSGASAVGKQGVWKRDGTTGELRFVELTGAAADAAEEGGAAPAPTLGPLSSRQEQASFDESPIGPERMSRAPVAPVGPTVEAAAGAPALDVDDANRSAAELAANLSSANRAIAELSSNLEQLNRSSSFLGK